MESLINEKYNKDEIKEAIERLIDWSNFLEKDYEDNMVFKKEDMLFFWNPEGVRYFIVFYKTNNGGSSVVWVPFKNDKLDYSSIVQYSCNFEKSLCNGCTILDVVLANNHNCWILDLLCFKGDVLDSVSYRSRKKLFGVRKYFKSSIFKMKWVDSMILRNLKPPVYNSDGIRIISKRGFSLRWKYNPDLKDKYFDRSEYKTMSIRRGEFPDLYYLPENYQTEKQKYLKISNISQSVSLFKWTEDGPCYVVCFRENEESLWESYELAT